MNCIDIIELLNKMDNKVLTSKLKIYAECFKDNAR